MDNSHLVYFILSFFLLVLHSFALSVALIYPANIHTYVLIYPTSIHTYVLIWRNFFSFFLFGDRVSLYPWLS